MPVSEISREYKAGIAVYFHSARSTSAEKKAMESSGRPG
jgi:hypothetical protein